MASMYNGREKYSQDVGTYSFGGAPTYQSRLSSSRAVQNDCNQAAGSCIGFGQPQPGGIPLGYSSFESDASRANCSPPTRPFGHGLFGDPDKPVKFGTFGDPNKPKTFGLFGSSNPALRATPRDDFITSHEPTSVTGFGVSRTHSDDPRLNANVARYPSPVRCQMSRKQRPVSHFQQPAPDTELVSKTPFYDQAFSTFGRF